ncbi:SPASM domain-containing protein [Pyrobaculum aerophilum]|uniref:SPASM domain-containing protein n=1 Tax=Pyrobaculum aerophilum TaxID=13773 RepID=UPI0023F3474D|nr:SPASM domain-containing protein [Pyrobaculum aerophilum]MCX8135651.1 SPASM domain-containing protein [Pyrobaculum aerophilum]
MDVVAITFAGATAATHNRIRVGNEFDVVLYNLREFVKIAKDIRTKTKIIAIYMMLRDTIEELPKFIELMAEIGVDEINLSNLTYIPNPSLWELKAYSEMFIEPQKRLTEILKKSKDIAKERGIVIRHRLFTPMEYPECPEAPTKTLYIGVDGDIYPCVYLSLAGFPRCFERKCHKIPLVSFGNLKTERLGDIIRMKAYIEFVQRFEMRKRAEFILPDPPEPCKKCYRLYWI